MIRHRISDNPIYLYFISNPVPRFTESEVESAALEWFAELGYQVLNGPDIAPGEPGAERKSYQEVLLSNRLKVAISRLNPKLPAEAQEDAFRKVTRLDSPSLVGMNRAFHRMLVDGVPVEYRSRDGRVVGDSVRLADFQNPDKNDWLVVNQFTVVEGHIERRPDIVVFLNGLPLAVLELKNPADENATVWTAFRQLETYKKQIPSLFAYNEVLGISDGIEARIGSLTANRERFMPWRTIEGEELAAASLSQLEVAIGGVFNRRRLLDLIQDFVVFEDRDEGTAKILAGYHQFHAVNRALESTTRAASFKGDRRGGVVWHTQGSGKSLTMAFYAGKLVLHPFMENPTIVVITDRNDLDDQLFGTFVRCRDLLRQTPVQAKSRTHLRELLKVAAGGVIFTTIQKFLPEEKGDTVPQLTDRKNVVVIADEAHRSQYDFIDGFARALREAIPKATFIGFTGTPIELADRNTRHVFGDYISIYDIQRAVHDNVTVPIYYESRLARLELLPTERPRIDPDFEEITEGEETERKERLKTKWAQLESVVGTERRVETIARDLVDHFESRLDAMDGKAMVVCMSRRICVELYNAIVKLRPQWDDDRDEEGQVKIVMTGSASDKADWQQHIRSKPRRELIANRFKDANDPLKVAIVRDMWLTGFDVPCLHTMYVDKPMKGHTLMQAIARVNRVFRDKPGGLVVDYLGLADQLRRALSVYVESGGQGATAVDQREAVAVMLEKYEICRALFHGFDYAPFLSGTPRDRLNMLPRAMEHILSLEDGQERLMKEVSALSKAFALAVPQKEAIQIRDDVAFFQAVRSAVAKTTTGTGKPGEELDFAVRQILSRAVTSNEVVDILKAAGLKKPDLSILSDGFLAELRGLQHRNLAVEVLRKLLADEIRARSRKNLVQSRSFAEMLQQTINSYHNRSIETVQVIEHLIELAKRMKDAQRRGEALKLTDEELAFYDALEVNDSAVKVLGDETLRTIARDLTETIRKNVTIDWTVRESVRANIRVKVKRVLRQHGYPPDKQEKATKTVLEQAELLAATWAEAEEGAKA